MGHATTTHTTTTAPPLIATPKTPGAPTPATTTTIQGAAIGLTSPPPTTLLFSSAACAARYAPALWPRRQGRSGHAGPPASRHGHRPRVPSGLRRPRPGAGAPVMPTCPSVRRYPHAGPHPMQWGHCQWSCWALHQHRPAATTGWKMLRHPPAGAAAGLVGHYVHRNGAGGGGGRR